MPSLRRYFTLEGVGHFDVIGSVVMIGLLDPHSSGAEMILLYSTLAALHFLLLGMVCWVQYLPWESVRYLYRTDLALSATALTTAALFPYELFMAAFAALLLWHLRTLRTTSQDLDDESILDASRALRRRGVLALPAPHAPRRTAQQ